MFVSIFTSDLVQTLCECYAEVDKAMNLMEKKTLFIALTAYSKLFLIAPRLKGDNHSIPGKTWATPPLVSELFLEVSRMLNLGKASQTSLYV